MCTLLYNRKGFCRSGYTVIGWCFSLRTLLHDRTGRHCSDHAFFGPFSWSPERGKQPTASTLTLWWLKNGPTRGGGGGCWAYFRSGPISVGGGGRGSKRSAPLFPGPQGEPAHGLHPRFVVAEIWDDRAGGGAGGGGGSHTRTGPGRPPVARMSTCGVVSPMGAHNNLLPFHSNAQSFLLASASCAPPAPTCVHSVCVVSIPSHGMGATWTQS